MNQIYLSRRNLETLLSKLDRQKTGDVTLCSLIKNQVLEGPYIQSMNKICVTAVDDDVYYGSQNREASIVYPLDTPRES